MLGVILQRALLLCGLGTCGILVIWSQLEPILLAIGRPFAAHNPMPCLPQPPSQHNNGTAKSQHHAHIYLSYRYEVVIVPFRKVT